MKAIKEQQVEELEFLSKELSFLIVNPKCEMCVNNTEFHRNKIEDFVKQKAKLLKAEIEKETPIIWKRNDENAKKFRNNSNLIQRLNKIIGEKE